MRGFVAFVAIAVLFASTVVFGGRAIGAWGDATPATPAGETTSSDSMPPGWSTYRVPRAGFALSVPIGWEAADPDTFRTKLAPLLRANRGLAGLVEAGFQGRSPLVKLFAFDVRREALAAAKRQRFATNVNVVVAPGPRPSRVGITSFRSTLGIRGRVERRRLALPAGRALQLRYRFRVPLSPGRSPTLAATQYAFWRKGSEYVVTFTTTPAQARSYAGLFRDSAETFRFIARRGPKPQHAVDPAQARWVREANALCRSARRELAQIPRPSSPAEFDAVLARLVPLNKRYNAEFSTLPTPPSFEKKVEKLRASFARDERLVAKLAAAARANSFDRVLDLAGRLAYASQDESAIMAELGARACDSYGFSAGS